MMIFRSNQDRFLSITQINRLEQKPAIMRLYHSLVPAQSALIGNRQLLPNEMGMQLTYRFLGSSGLGVLGAHFQVSLL